MGRIVPVEGVAAGPRTAVREAEPFHALDPLAALREANLGIRPDRHLWILVLPHGLLVKPHLRRDLELAVRDARLAADPRRRGALGLGGASRQRQWQNQRD